MLSMQQIHHSNRATMRVPAALFLVGVLTSVAAAQGVDHSKYVGNWSCSAVACHGRDEPRAVAGVAQNEFVRWTQVDPHARSTATIWGEKFAAILRRLGAVEDDKWNLVTYRQCAGCHDPENARSHESNSDSSFAFISLNAVEPRGVGCESCHGSAKDWLDVHYERDARQELLSRQGMLLTENLFVRSQVCASCHVGSRENNMNHDMIAAGHPALHFEMTSYHGRLSPHWPAVNERRATPDYHAQLWAAGQVAAAEAAIQLLRGRAEQATSAPGQSASPSKPWPEFSEYSCLGCHQRLRTPDDQRRLRFSNDQSLRPGQPTWNAWFLALPMESAARDVNKSALKSRADWQTLRTQMLPLGATNPQSILEFTSAAQASLRSDFSLLENAQVGQRAVSLSTRDLVSVIRQAAPRADSWESLCQVFLALQAARRDYHDHRSARPSTAIKFKAKHPGRLGGIQELDGIRRSLAFSNETDVPSGLLHQLTIADPKTDGPASMAGGILTLDHVRQEIIRQAEQLAQYFAQLDHAAGN